MASLTAAPTAIDIDATAEHGEPVRFWSLFNRLERTTLGARDADGAIRVLRSTTGGCVLYGPYYHFEMDRYRLSIHARAGSSSLSDQPVLGIEIIILSRFQRAWRDYTATELAQ